MLVRNIFSVLVVLLSGTCFAYSQDTHTEIYIDFRVNSTSIDSTYSDNTANLRQIQDFIQNIKQDSTLSLVNVSFCGAASPEGSYQLNRRLARGRLETLENVVRSQIEIPDNIITYDDSYISWDFLREQVEANHVTHKQEVLDIIDQEPHLVDYPGDRHIDHRIVALQKLDGGKVWRQLHKLYFERMRNACVIFVTYKKELPQPTEPEVIPEEKPQIIPEQIPDTTSVAETIIADVWTRGLHIKSNALGWGTAIANAAVEIDLAKHWSFTLPVYYSAWNYFTQPIKFRTLAFQPEFRYWLSEKNDGFFAGAHFGLAYYNVAVHGDYRYQDHDRNSPALGGGINIGYRLPLSADRRWRVEFSLGGGAYSLYYDKFYNTPSTKDGLLIESVKKTYWGIDQMAISFSYTFDLKKKGGKR